MPPLTAISPALRTNYPANSHRSAERSYCRTSSHRAATGPGRPAPMAAN